MTDTSVAREHDELVNSTEQPFLSHLIELRARILRGALAVLLLFFPIYYFALSLWLGGLHRRTA